MKGTAYCTCKVCGKKFTKTFVDSGRGASDRVDAKVKWAEEGGIDTCPECYATKKQAEIKAQGLTCDVVYRKTSLWSNETSPKLYAIFEGDTYPHKDALKAAGCKWTDEYPYRTKRGASGLPQTIEPKKTWVLTVDADKKEVIEELLIILNIEATWPKRKQQAEAPKETEAPKEPETPKAPEAPKGGRVKKLTIEQAVAQLSNVRDAAELEEVLERCSVATLKIIAKATEHKMKVKVLCRYRRTDLLNILVQHSTWLLQLQCIDKRIALEECVQAYNDIKLLKAQKRAEDWHKVWMERMARQYESVRERALMACKRAMLITVLNITVAQRVSKAAIISQYFHR